MTTISYTETLVTVTCTCGINFAVPETLNRQALDERGPNGRSLCCPLGHHWHYTGKTDAQKYREQLEQARRDAAQLTHQLDQERASHSATKGQVTKLKKRVGNGVCPCCKRTFKQLARHMAGQHPEFVGEIA